MSGKEVLKRRMSALAAEQGRSPARGGADLPCCCCNTTVYSPLPRVVGIYQVLYQLRRNVLANCNDEVCIPFAPVHQEHFRRNVNGILRRRDTLRSAVQAVIPSDSFRQAPAWPGGRVAHGV